MNTLSKDEKSDRARLRQALDEIQGLSTTQILHAMRAMIADDVVMFLSLENQEEKYEFVLLVLGLI